MEKNNKLKEYSCVKKTKRAFEDALAELSAQKPFNKITVMELCNKAQLSRNAFYFHYSDINALLENIQDNIINEVTDKLIELREIGFPKNMLETIKFLVNLLEDRQEIALMLLDQSVPSNLIPRLSKIFCDFNFEYYKAFHKSDNRETYDLFYTFVSVGFYGMFREWLASDNPINSSHFTALSYSLIKRLLVLDDIEPPQIS